MEDSLKVAIDNVLLFRMLYLWHLADSRSMTKVYGLLEHPADPAWATKIPGRERCPTIWVTQAVQEWIKLMHLQVISFDQCMLGQKVPKTTTVATNLELLHLDNLFCDNNHQHQQVQSSSELSRYPPAMMKAIAKSLLLSTRSSDALGSDRARVSDRP